jgi:hypothetical protein
MSHTFVISALARRRAELASECGALQARLDQLRATREVALAVVESGGSSRRAMSWPSTASRSCRRMPCGGGRVRRLGAW